MANRLDSMGPRIDISQEPPDTGYTSGRATPPPSYRGGDSGGGRLWGLSALAVGLIALGVGFWAVMAMPERIPGPLPSADVVPGGTAERVAKLEKDVSGLMLRLVTLEKELEAVRARAGAVNKLVELNVKVQALQERLDGLGARPAPRAPAAPAPAPAAEEPAAKPEAKPAAKPEVKTAPKAAAEKPAEDPAKKTKHTYTVRRGDTLFMVAQRYDVSMKDVMRWNDLKAGEPIKVDQKLVIYK
ncbi:MAG: LysM peptidoglycan-binding domain-containing protein [Thermodesulfobacteriota bacterium]